MEKLDLKKLKDALPATPKKSFSSGTTCITPLELASMSQHLRVESHTTIFETDLFDRDLLSKYGIRIDESQKKTLSYAIQKLGPDFPWEALSPTVLLPKDILNKPMHDLLLAGLEEQRTRFVPDEPNTIVNIKYVDLDTPINLNIPNIMPDMVKTSFSDQLSDDDSSFLKIQLKAFVNRKPREDSVQMAASFLAEEYFGAVGGPTEVLYTQFLLSEDGTTSPPTVKPDISAGYLTVGMDDNKSAVARHDLPELHRAAEVLNRLDKQKCIMGTHTIFLPLVLGELKGNDQPGIFIAPDGYKLFYEMAASYRTHDAFWKHPPKFVFGLHHSNGVWRLFAMGADLEPVEVAVIRARNVADYLYFLTICRRLGKYIKGTLAQLEVSDSKVQLIFDMLQATADEKNEKRRLKYRAKTDKERTTRRDEDDDDSDDHGGDKKKDHDSRDYSTPTRLFKTVSDKPTQQGKTRGSSRVPVKGRTFKLADTPILIEHVNGLTFAIKVEHPRRISRELYCYNKLKDCLYVPRVLGSGMTQNQQAFLRLPYLQQLPMPKNAAQFHKISRQIVAALRAVHKQGLVHCDIKDDNIMWDQATDTVQIIDFESAIELKDGCTFGLNYGGTSLFMSPELLQYKKDATHSTATNKSDVFSAGLVLAGLMYGVRIRSEGERQLVLRKLRKQDVSAVSDKQAVNLLSAMTSAENRRPSAEDCLKHPFLADKAIQRVPSMNTPRRNKGVASNSNRSRDLGRSIRQLNMPLSLVSTSSPSTLVAPKQTPLRDKITNRVSSAVTPKTSNGFNVSRPQMPKIALKTKLFNSVSATSNFSPSAPVAKRPPLQNITNSVSHHQPSKVSQRQNPQ